MAPEPSGSPIVKDHCPAFLNGCPYASSEKIADWIRKQDPVNKDRCPAFSEGCPFRGVQDMGGLRQALQELPESHAGGNHAAERDSRMSPSSAEGDVAPKDTQARNMLVEMLHAVHEASQTVKESVGNDCPVFQQACPFKNCLTSSGTPLVLELEARSWNLMVSDVAEPKNTEEQPNLGENEAIQEDVVDVGLALQLKEGTREAHRAAETVHFVREFIKGRVTREVYGQMIVNLYHVYLALEEGLDKCWEHPMVEYMYFPDELKRSESLRQDAEFFWGPGWEDRRKPSLVTVEYVERLRDIASTAPELLVPHSYTRYLGDLSGGQVLKRAAIRGLKLLKDGSEGVNFYNFKRIPNPNKFKNMYRARLDALEADRTVADNMVIEANYAFALNTRMFQELDQLAGFENDPEAIAAAEAVRAAAIERDAALENPSDAPACPFAVLANAGFAKPADHPPVQEVKTSNPASLTRRKEVVKEPVKKEREKETKTVAPKSNAKVKAVLAHVFMILLCIMFVFLMNL